MKYYYLLLDLLSVAYPLAQSFEKKLMFYKKWRFLLPGVLAANLIYIPWDIWFTHKGVWGFNEKYITGLSLWGLPIEEWLFFVAIPFACFFIYEVALYFFKPKPFKTAPLYHGILALVLLILGFRNMDHTYTAITFWGCAFTLLIAGQVIPRARWSYFWIMYGLSLIPFLLVNGALTGSFTPEPVVWYNNAENLGIRLFTIPVEDTVYLLFYLLIIYMFYERGSAPETINSGD